MSEKDNEKHEERDLGPEGRDLQSDSEEKMDPGRVLEAGELNLEVLEGSDEEATEALEKIIKKKKTTKKKTKAKKTTPKPRKPKTVTVRYDGSTQMGTEDPRRMWRPGDTMKVSPELAETLLKIRGFTRAKRKR